MHCNFEIHLFYALSKNKFYYLFCKSSVVKKSWLIKFENLVIDNGLSALPALPVPMSIYIWWFSLTLKKSFKSSNLKREKFSVFIFIPFSLDIIRIFFLASFWKKGKKKNQPSLKPEIFLQWIGNLFVPYQPSVSKSSCYIEAMPSHFKDFSEQQSYPVISSRLVSSRAGHCSMTHFQIERRR